MNVAELDPPRGLTPLKYSVHEVPHVVIEPNLTCNATCRACYREASNHVKTLEAIEAELEYALSRRKVETVSLLGGEPTLHPALVDVVRRIKTKGLTCELLTNGLVLDHDDGRLLNELHRAKLDRIVLHADVGQGRSSEEQQRFIAGLFDQFERIGIFFALAVTVYADNAGTLPQLMKRYAHYGYFDGILATLVRERDAHRSGWHSREGAPSLLEEHRAIRLELGIQPATYVPSNLDDASVRWLMYFYFINFRTGRTFSVSPPVNRLYRRLSRWIAGRYVFGPPLQRRWFLPVFAVTSALELVSDPPRCASWVRLMRDAKRGNALRLHYIVLQAGPEFNERHNTLELCYHCPDATVRNGKLTPVCLADILRPIPESGDVADPEALLLRRVVDEHLGEC